MEHSLQQQLTDLRRENARLNQQLEFAKNFMDNTNCWETYRDKTGKIIYISPNFEKVLGQRKDAYLQGDLKITDFIHQDDIEKTVENYKKVFGGQDVSPHKCKLKSNMPYKHVLISYKRVYQDDGEFTGIRTSISNITKLEKQEKNYQALLKNLADNIPAFIALINKNFKCVFINNSYSGFEFFDREKFLGKRVVDIVGVERFEKLLPLYHQVLNGKPVEYESEHYSENQGQYIFKVNLVPHYNKNEVAGFFVYAFDVTEMRKAENIIRESEHRFKVLFKQSHIGTAIVGLNKSIIKCNEAFCRLLGYSEKELLGKTIAHITHPEDREIGMNELDRIVSGELEYALLKKRYLNKDGSVIWGELTISAVLNEDNRPLHFIAVIQDITKRLQAEEGLKESEKKLRLITNNIPALVGQVDSELKYIYANKRYEYYSGIEAHTIVGKKVIDVIGEETFLISLPYMQRALSGEVVSFETSYANSAGEIFYFQSNFVPNIENNHVKNFFVLAWDITEAKKNESVIREQNELLKNSNETKDKMFSIISHDLRSPVNNMVTLFNLLNEVSIDDSQFDEFTALASSSAQNTLALLDNLLNWSKSQTGSLHSQPAKIILSSLLIKSKENAIPRAVVKNISLNIIGSKEIEIYTDENMVDVVLRNLISNAIKFTMPGGRIDISFIQKQDFVEFSVSDNGIGMSEDKLEKLFKIDSDSCSVGTANEKGSGLGLMLCKEFVEQLGGRIWAESNIGEGSNFKFTLPLLKSA